LNHKYLLAIPVFNEEPYVQHVLDRSRRYAPNILVIDDGSTDQTAALLGEEKDITVIRHNCNQGYGQSLIDAFAFAIREGYDWLITMDCDEQHEPDAIPTFVSAMADDGADIISGSRYLDATLDADQPPADRRAINQRITRMINEHLKLNITDAFCGFKAYRTPALARMRITEPGYAMPLQLWVQAARLRLGIRELPIRLVYNDPNRHFGGELDDPAARYQHYLDVYGRSLRDWDQSITGPSAGCSTRVASHSPCMCP